MGLGPRLVRRLVSSTQESRSERHALDEVELNPTSQGEDVDKRGAYPVDYYRTDLGSSPCNLVDLH